MKKILVILLALLPLGGWAQGRISVKFTPDGWASLSADGVVSIPEGIDAYVGILTDATTDEADYTLHLYRVSLPVVDKQRILPKASGTGYAHNPVVLRSTTYQGQTVGLTVVSADLDEPSHFGNLYEPYAKMESVGLLLGTEGSTFAAPVEGHTYVLGYQNEKAAFYEVKPGREVSAHRAYVRIEEVNNVRLQTLQHDTTTDIHATEIAAPVADEALYTLRGQRVGQPRRGELYIKGNRKIIYK